MSKNFGEKLTELRKDKELSVIELSKLIGFSKSVIYFWENGQREPTANALSAISKFFNVSTDYLLGLEDDFGIKTKNNVVKEILSDEPTKEEIEMIKKIRLMDTYSQTYIKAQIDALSATAKNKQKEKV